MEMRRPTWMAGWIEGLIVGWGFGLLFGSILTLAYVQSHPNFLH